MKHLRTIIVILLLFICTYSSSVNAFAASSDNNESLIIGVPTDRCPVFYVDTNTKEIVGIGADLMRYAAEKAGYDVTFKLLTEPTLKESLDNEEYDLIMPFGSAIQSAQGKASIVSEPLFLTPFTLVTVNNKELPDLNNIKVGMLHSLGGGAETVKQLYPGIEIIFYDTMADSVSGLTTGGVDALLHNSYVWSYVLQKPAYSNLSLQPQSMFSMDFRVGTLDTPKGRAIIERLNKGIVQVPETQKQAVVLDYTTRKLYKNNFFDFVYQNGFLISVVLIIFLIITVENNKLKKAEKIAEEASKAKSLFLANMSHEIRTPINTIMGMGEMITRETTDNKVKQYAYSINRSANSLLSLVNDILDFSKMEAGKLKLRSEPYHLSSLLTDVDVMIKGRAKSKDLAYNVNINKSIPDKLIGDETRLKQVMINLLTNAVKYTLKGFINLNIDYAKVDEENIDLTITVEDSGIGMKPEEVDKLFTAFERLDEDRNRTIEGTGLGMSIVKQILDAMGSTIDVNSIYGSGSTFSFTIRQKVSNWSQIGDYKETAQKVVNRQITYQPKFIAPDARVLIVDDTEINITVIRGLLEPTKMHVDSALSGKQALKMLESTKYDILLLDYRMPEMDGLELLRHIKSDLENMNYYSVCIVLTANAVEGAREMYIRAGFDEYLEKPVIGRQLEAMLLKFLPQDKILEQGTSQSIEPAKSDDSSIEPQDAGITSEALKRLHDDGIIDVDYGVQYSGSEKVFLEALRLFRSSIDKKADEIEELYFKEDIPNYTIKVHALKSSARIIGAQDLSDKAKELEEAGKRNDMDYIRDHNSEVLEEYCKYKKLLADI